MAGRMLWGLCALLATFAGASVVEDGLLVDFGLSRAECLAGSFADAAPANLLGALERNNATTWCLDGVGVGGQEELVEVHVASSRNASALAAALADAVAAGSDGITVELWLEVRTLGDSLEHQPIFALGSRDAANTVCDGNVGLRISEVGNELEIEMVFQGESPYDDGEMTSGDCLSKTTDTSLLDHFADGPAHLVVAVGERVDVYVDGALDYSKNFLQGYDYATFDFAAAWPADEFVVELFSDGVARRATSGYDGFDGDALALRVYDRKLTADEVAANYAAALPNSPPVVEHMAVTIHEDGERDAGALVNSTPRVYAAPLPFGLLGSVSLAATDVDDDEAYPTYGGAAATAYVASLPDVGELYLADGTRLESADLPVAVAAADGYGVVARPPRDAFGAAAAMAFTYYAVDGVTGVASATASVSLTVAAVNDPPTPSANETLFAFAGARTSLLLGGADVDDALYAAVVFGAGADVRLTGSDGLDAVGRDLADRVVFFEFVGNVTPGTMDPATGVFRNDSFAFALVDPHGARGYTANVSVAVASPAVATPTAAQEVGERGYASTTVALHGADASDARADVCFEITKLPAHGVLYDPAGGAGALAVGSVLAGRSSYPYDAGAAVDYVGETSYFNVPEVRWDGGGVGADPDAIAYAAVDCAAPARRSPDAAQPVAVRNVNDAPTLTAATLAFEVYAAGGGAADDDDAYPSEVLLAGLGVGDDDLDVDAVRVDVAAGKYSSLLSLDGDLLAGADFNSAAYCFGNDGWSCHGDGTTDQSFSFLAAPDLADALLKTLTFRSTAANSRDVVAVAIYDGAGGNCLAAHASESHRPTCFARNVSLTVEVGAYATFASSSDNDNAGLPWQLALGVLGLGVVVVCSCAIQCYRTCCRTKEQRDAARKRISSSFARGNPGFGSAREFELHGSKPV